MRITLPTYWYIRADDNSGLLLLVVAFKVYDMDRDGYISNGELFLVLKMMVGNNLKDGQLQQIVDKTIMEADKDGDGKLSFDEFVQMVSNTVRVLASFFTASSCRARLTFCPS